MRIPYDSLTLAAVLQEIRTFEHGKVQRISQVDDFTVVLGIYANGGEGYLLLSCDPEFFRVHWVTRRPANQPTPPQFCAALRSKLDQARLRHASQRGFDRVLDLDFETSEGVYRLTAELMGKHSNLVLYGPDSRIVGVAKPIGVSKSVRPLLPGRQYAPPPTQPRKSLLGAREGDDLKGLEGASPFVVRLLDSGLSLGQLQDLVRERSYNPVLSPGNGAYPISVASLGLTEFARNSISIALEQHYAVAEPQHRATQLKASLLGQLGRVRIAREAAVSDLRQASDAARRAGELQLKGELTLAYGPSLEPGSTVLVANDYEGRPIEIRLEPELDYKQNAQRFFDKAKRSKSGQAMVVEQLKRQEADLEAISGFLSRLEATERLEELEDLRDTVRARHWIQAQVAAAKKEDRPYEGNRVRELIGPGGATVLYGENATSNDYLTLRVARPDDYWLHIRGSASAHVVIRTNRQPDRVGPELLLFAAKIAVANSPSKHSGFVPVDYTLRKYVRKPRGAAPGTALYTHEKTLHVEG